MTRSAFGLTGLEQYSLERAGYFVRRSLLDEERLRTARDVAGGLSAILAEGTARAELHATDQLARELTEITGLAADLIPSAQLRSVTLYPVGERASSTWFRDLEIDPALSAPEQLALLNGSPPIFHVRIALSSDASLAVLPGSHMGPLSPDQAITLLSKSTSALGEIRVRLTAGDVLVYSSMVLRREDMGSDVSGDLLELVFAHRTAQDPLPSNSAGFASRDSPFSTTRP